MSHLRNILCTFGYNLISRPCGQWRGLGFFVVDNEGLVHALSAREDKGVGGFLKGADIASAASNEGSNVHYLTQSVRLPLV